jgi:prepilin-type N-terminal cleavage/methylation domain-containing protein
MSLTSQMSGRPPGTPAAAAPAGNAAAANRLIHGVDGFTLIEMLVAILAGLVVTFATFAILEISLHQSSRVIDRISANQRGRIVMEKIVSELHSSCVAVSTVPIVKGSEGKSLQMISQTGSQVSFASVAKHKISLSGTTLTDATYNSSGGVAPNWTFPSSPTSSQTLLTGVTQTGATPIFRYFKYESGALSTTELTPPLTETQAKSTAAVTIGFSVAPESANTGKGRSVEFSNTVLLRFDPASSTGLNTPCT